MSKIKKGSPKGKLTSQFNYSEHGWRSGLLEALEQVELNHNVDKLTTKELMSLLVNKYGVKQKEIDVVFPELNARFDKELRENAEWETTQLVGTLNENSDAEIIVDNKNQNFSIGIGSIGNVMRDFYNADRTGSLEMPKAIRSVGISNLEDVLLRFVVANKYGVDATPESIKATMKGNEDFQRDYALLNRALVDPKHFGFESWSDALTKLDSWLRTSYGESIKNNEMMADAVDFFSSPLTIEAMKSYDDAVNTGTRIKINDFKERRYQQARKQADEELGITKPDGKVDFERVISRFRENDPRRRISEVSAQGNWKREDYEPSDYDIQNADEHAFEATLQRLDSNDLEDRLLREDLEFGARANSSIYRDKSDRVETYSWAPNQYDAVRNAVAKELENRGESKDILDDYDIVPVNPDEDGNSNTWRFVLKDSQQDLFKETKPEDKNITHLLNSIAGDLELATPSVGNSRLLQYPEIMPDAELTDGIAGGFGDNRISALRRYISDNDLYEEIQSTGEYQEHFDDYLAEEERAFYNNMDHSWEGWGDFDPDSGHIAGTAELRDLGYHNLADHDIEYWERGFGDEDVSDYAPTQHENISDFAGAMYHIRGFDENQTAGGADMVVAEIQADVFQNANPSHYVLNQKTWIRNALANALSEAIRGRYKTMRIPSPQKIHEAGGALSGHQRYYGQGGIYQTETEKLLREILDPEQTADLIKNQPNGGWTVNITALRQLVQEAGFDPQSKDALFKILSVAGSTLPAAAILSTAFAPQPAQAEEMPVPSDMLLSAHDNLLIANGKAKGKSNAEVIADISEFRKAIPRPDERAQWYGQWKINPQAAIEGFKSLERDLPSLIDRNIYYDMNSKYGLNSADKFRADTKMVDKKIDEMRHNQFRWSPNPYWIDEEKDFPMQPSEQDLDLMDRIKERHKVLVDRQKSLIRYANRQKAISPDHAEQLTMSAHENLRSLGYTQDEVDRGLQNVSPDPAFDRLTGRTPRGEKSTMWGNMIAQVGGLMIGGIPAAAVIMDELGDMTDETKTKVFDVLDRMTYGAADMGDLFNVIVSDPNFDANAPIETAMDTAQRFVNMLGLGEKGPDYGKAAGMFLEASDPFSDTSMSDVLQYLGSGQDVERFNEEEKAMYAQMMPEAMGAMSLPYNAGARGLVGMGMSPEKAALTMSVLEMLVPDALELSLIGLGGKAYQSMTPEQQELAKQSADYGYFDVPISGDSGYKPYNGPDKPKSDAGWFNFGER